MVWNIFRSATEKDVIPSRAAVSAPCALERRLSAVNARNLSPGELSKKVMRKALSVSSKNTDKKEADGLSAAAVTTLLEISLTVDQPLTF